MPVSSASASSNSARLPDSSARSISPAVSWPLSRRWRISGRISPPAVSAASATVAFSQASLVMRLGAVVGEPFARGDEIGERLRQLGDQRLAGRRRQIVARQQRVADHREMAVPRDDAVERERHDLGVRIFQQHQAGLGAADLGDRRRDRRTADPARPAIATWRAGIAGRDRIDQIGVEEQRRALAAPARPRRADRRRAHGRRSAAPLRCAANTSASARRTSGDGSSSSMIMAPSAAARSLSERSE